MDARPSGPLTADDLYRFQLITGYDLSPDGRQAVYALQRVDRKTQKRYSNLWLMPVQGGQARQFTVGDQVDAAPRWSPDGRQIAFLSNRGNEKQSQLYIIPADGGEARKITELAGSLGEFAWSPNGRSIVLSFRPRDEEEIAREEDELKRELGIVARHITRSIYRADGEGFLPQAYRQLHIVDVADGQSRRLTNGMRDEVNPVWSPDGKTIAFVANRTSDPDWDQMNLSLCLVSAAGGEVTELALPEGRKQCPSFSPDGARLAYFCSEGVRQFWQNMDLWIVPLADQSAARNLTGHTDITTGDLTLGDTDLRVAFVPPAWSSDGEALYVNFSRHGRTFVGTVQATDGTVEQVLGEDDLIGSLSPDAAGRSFLYLRATATTPGDLWLWDAENGSTRQLTQVNAGWLDTAALNAPEEHWIDGPDGNRLQGWILKPPDFDPARSYPVILEIHGGPQLQYGHGFFHELHMLAGLGYVVCYCNPRGSQGYGNRHVNAIVDDFGAVAYSDLMAWTDYVAARPYVDTRRMGVTGGSYGGYMTNWIVSHTDRFAAAVTQRSLCNLISFHGTSDFTWLFQCWFNDAPPWERLDDYRRQSPLNYVAAVQTPTMVIHAEGDRRVNVEQSEQWYTALRQVGVESEFVRIEAESHGLSRAGRTDRRIARLEYLVGWFARYL
ncbi:MAG: S9 family peptidase [Caldilineaceae bacterium]|nr:S9 family peptidase [Caldilineaceae bacterium]